MNNRRHIPMRKQVQILVALTLLAWATQTLFAQWSRGAEAAAEPARASSETTSFVPRDGVLRGGTIELRGEARVHGAEVRLKQACRWSDADAAMFAPVADLVLAKLDARRPYKVVDVGDVRQLLADAGVNVALVRFSGATECTASRTDAELKEGEALEQWIKARQGVVDDEPPAPRVGREAASIASPQAEAQLAGGGERDDSDGRTLRDALAADLAVRLSLPQEQIVLGFDPRDEGVLNLPEPQFKFNIEPRRARDLGDVAWDVAVVSPAGDSRPVQIRGTARAWQHQLVVARPLNRRQQITEADVTARRTLVDRLPDGALLTGDQVVGQMAARDLQPGTVVTAPLVEAVPLARVGQFITVTLERGSVRVKSVGKALEGGSYGETIRVKNEATKDVYQVVLTGPQEGSVMPAGAAAKDDGGVASARN